MSTPPEAQAPSEPALLATPELICYRTEEDAPRLVPGRPDREWMDMTDQRYAYRCIPLSIANASGWEILLPAPFSATWTGGNLISDIQIRPLRDPARVHRFRDGMGDIGVIASVTEPFCGSCDRLRVTPDGKLRTCLFSTWETDLKGPMRAGAGDADLAGLFRSAVAKKEAGHGINHESFVKPARAMYAIGG